MFVLSFFLKFDFQKKTIISWSGMNSLCVNIHNDWLYINEEYPWIHWLWNLPHVGVELRAPHVQPNDVEIDGERALSVSGCKTNCSTIIFTFGDLNSKFSVPNLKKKNSFPVRETKNLTNVCWFRRPSISLSRFIKIIRKCRIVSFQVDSLNQFQVNQVIGRRVEYSVTHCLARILFVPVSVGSDQSDSANPDYFPWMFCVDADVQACRLYWLWLSREGKAAHVTQVFPLSSLRPRLRHKMSAERRALCDWIG
jgi:hypothetical protein